MEPPSTIVNETPQNEPVVGRVGSHAIFMRANTPDEIVAKSCFGGEFDRAISAARPLRHRLIIDAGGYIGTAAIVFAEAFPDATVVTLEPSLENFMVLKKNVSPYRNVVPLNVALGREPGRRTLHNRKTGQWGYSIVANPSDCKSPELLHGVDVITIQDILADFKSSGIDILKLDIEGAEYELLQDGAPWLTNVHVLVAELHDRIIPGCTVAFKKATARRRNTRAGEKVVSILD